MAQRRRSFLLLSLLLVTLLIGSGVAAQMPTASSSIVHLPLIVGGGMAPTPTTPPAITGYVQKGPFIQGSSITVRELDSNFTPTGRTFTGSIDDNTGRFSVRGTLTSTYVELEANGFYFNEVTGTLSVAPLRLLSVADLRVNTTININLLTHLERSRLSTLLDGGMEFTSAKAQAQQEVLAAFNLTSSAIGNSETLDISQSGEGNAILLAVSVILQGNRSEAQLTELLATLSSDLRTDGLLSNTVTRQALIDGMEYVKPRRAAIRANIVARYAALGVPATVPNFESYAFLLDTVAPSVASTAPGSGADQEVDAIRMHFSELMQHATLTSSTVRVTEQSGSSVTGTLVATDSDNTTTAVFTPTNKLPPGSYQVLVTTDVRDLAGNTPVTATLFSFTQTPLSEVTATNSGPTRLESTTSLTATVPGNSSRISYTWDFGDGTTGSGATPSKTYAAVGSYVATVTATNGDEQAMDSTTVNVIDRPITGLAVTHSGPTLFTKTTTFTATILDGSNVSYTWDFGDGTTGSGATPSKTFGAVGNYTATVTATNSVSTAVSSTQVTVVNYVSAVSAGRNHTCALTAVGGVKCWGDNEFGQLGDGTTTDRLTPVDVSGLSSGVAAISVGRYHTCALTTAGGIKCWGDNVRSQLGDGTITNRLTPVDVSGLGSGIIAISVGNSHTCALTTAGGVKCWGWNAFGQIGDGTTINRSTPVDVSGLSSSVTAVSVGSSHSCVLTTAGSVKCWGYNQYGQLGGGQIDRLTPMDVSGLSSGVAVISAGAGHTCALTTVGGVKCWGYNMYGQIGDGTTTNRFTPVDVSGLNSGVTAISAGGFHTCALTTISGVKCWGYNMYGQLGDETTTNRLTPVDVKGLTSSVTTISVGFYHTCALIMAGGIKCWGYNEYGQIGDGTTTNRLTPVDVIWSP